MIRWKKPSGPEENAMSNPEKYHETQKKINLSMLYCIDERPVI